MNETELTVLINNENIFKINFIISLKLDSIKECCLRKYNFIIY